MHTLLKLIGRTGTIGIAGTLPTGVEQANYNAAPREIPSSLEGKLNPFALHLRNRKS